MATAAVGASPMPISRVFEATCEKTIVFTSPNHRAARTASSTEHAVRIWAAKNTVPMAAALSPK